MPDKVVLTKNRKHVSFDKRAISLGPLRITTYWNYVPGAFDLDLNAFWKDRYGGQGVVQALGEHFGSFYELPYLQLHGDDRIGGKGELITGDTKMILRSLTWVGFGLLNHRSRRPLSQVEGAVTKINIPGLPEIVVEHGQQNTSVCSILQIHIIDGELRVERDLRALKHGVFPWRARTQEQALDRHWGFKGDWSPGTKR